MTRGISKTHSFCLKEYAFCLKGYAFCLKECPSRSAQPEPMADLTKKYDVLVAGGGNAALCAAVAAARAGSSVLVVEMASKFYRGGNTRHTRNVRCAHDAATETLSGPYPEEELFSDLLQVTKGATDEALARHMIHESK